MIPLNTDKVLAMCRQLGRTFLHQLVIEREIRSLMPVRKKQPSYPINNRRGFAANHRRQAKKRRKAK